MLIVVFPGGFPLDNYHRPPFFQDGNLTLFYFFVFFGFFSTGPGDGLITFFSSTRDTKARVLSLTLIPPLLRFILALVPRNICSVGQFALACGQSRQKLRSKIHRRRGSVWLIWISFLLSLPSPRSFPFIVSSMAFLSRLRQSRRSNDP